MDVERTMEFILKQQAKAETQMASTRKLITTGTRMVVEQSENLDRLSGEVKAVTADVKELTKSQRATDSWRRGGNGRHSRN